MKMRKFRVGDAVWLHSSVNREGGRWWQLPVTGVTKTELTLGEGPKAIKVDAKTGEISKETPRPHFKVYLKDEEAELLRYREVHLNSIVELVRGAVLDKLKEVATSLGYSDEGQPLDPCAGMRFEYDQDKVGTVLGLWREWNGWGKGGGAVAWNIRKNALWGWDREGWYELQKTGHIRILNRNIVNK